MLHPHNKFRQEIYSTLAYFDIFEYPVTEDELYRFAHTSQHIPQKDFSKALSKALSEIPHRRVDDYTFYFLPDRKKLVKGREHRRIISEKKIARAKKIIDLLGRIPMIAFIGISGSLAMRNGDDESDVDLFIIAFPHTVWTTRFVVWMLLGFTALRRKRNTQGKDTLCVNMVMDRDHLTFVKERQDIYTAHEIIHVDPVVNKYQTHELFLQKNRWIHKYMANSFEENEAQNEVFWGIRFMLLLITPLESFLMIIQLWYMRTHRTIEQTNATFIAFHPYDYRATIIKEFETRYKQYGI